MTALAKASRPVASGEPHELPDEADDDSPPIQLEVKGSALVIINWSTLWSQPQLKRRLLMPLGGKTLRVSPDGISASLEFGNEETAERALRICRLAEAQAEKE